MNELSRCPFTHQLNRIRSREIDKKKTKLCAQQGPIGIGNMKNDGMHHYLCEEYGLRKWADFEWKKGNEIVFELKAMTFVITFISRPSSSSTKRYTVGALVLTSP